jgi:hypothetical protein
MRIVADSCQNDFCAYTKTYRFTILAEATIAIPKPTYIDFFVEA